MRFLTFYFIVFACNSGLGYAGPVPNFLGSCLTLMFSLYKYLSLSALWVSPPVSLVLV